MYRNETNFCILILYPTTLLNLFISCNTFLADYLGFSIYKISCHLQSKTITLLLFQFISSFSLIAMARTSKTMLNNSGKSGILVLFLILEEMLSAFHH